ncbi:MAG TPA: metal-dependent hydrolase [Pyrinomonadaceae bacterium]|nr:metal-dependent hydrolase [Pyrinomonadaceae bacterium]
MFIFGHLGIGSKMVYPWRAELPRAALLLGTILPDLIDKPLYYIPVAFVGREAATQSLISGTRTFGHTLILLLAVVVLAVLKRSRLLAALAAGMATHNLLDLIGDQVQLGMGWAEMGPGPSGIHALLWPLLGWDFPASTTTIIGHGLQLMNPWFIGCEVAGLCILLWDYRRRKSRRESSAT